MVLYTNIETMRANAMGKCTVFVPTSYVRDRCETRTSASTACAKSTLAAALAAPYYPSPVPGYYPLVRTERH